MICDIICWVLMNAKVSTIAPMWNIQGYVSYPNGWQATGTIYLAKNASQRTIYHEFGHYTFQRYFASQNPEFKATKALWKGDGVDYEDMAITFAKWKLGQKIDQKYIDWFIEHTPKKTSTRLNPQTGLLEKYESSYN